MKQFISGLNTVDTSIVNNLIYQGRRTTASGAIQTGHIQGIAIDQPNDKVYISYTSGVVCYKWSDLSLLYQTTSADIDDGTGTVAGTHIGDIAIHNGFLYGGNALDFFTTITPARNVVHEWNLNDLTLNRGVESLFPHACGAFGSDGVKLYTGYGDELVVDGVLQSINLTTLEKSTDSEIIVPRKTNGAKDLDDFGFGVQSFTFMDDNQTIAFNDYNAINAVYTGGSNVKFADRTTLVYDKFRDGQVPEDYGIDTIGSKAYIIQKNNGTDDTKTDILEFNIIT